MYSNWSRTTLYLAIITLHKAILAGVLDFKMAALLFFNNSTEVILTIEIKLQRAIANEFGRAHFTKNI